MRTFLRYVFVGIVVGVIAGFLLSRVSGNIRVVEGIGALGLLVGIVLGIVHRHDR